MSKLNLLFAYGNFALIFINSLLQSYKMLWRIYAQTSIRDWKIGGSDRRGAMASRQGWIQVRSRKADFAVIAAGVRKWKY